MERPRRTIWRRSDAGAHYLLTGARPVVTDRIVTSMSEQVGWLTALRRTKVVALYVLGGSDQELAKLRLIGAIPVASHVAAVGVVVDASPSLDLNVSAGGDVDCADPGAVRPGRWVAQGAELEFMGRARRGRRIGGCLHSPRVGAPRRRVKPAVLTLCTARVRNSLESSGGCHRS